MLLFCPIYMPSYAMFLLLYELKVQLIDSHLNWTKNSEAFLEQESGDHCNGYSEC